jgi:deoxycytidylate deaminase
LMATAPILTDPLYVGCITLAGQTKNDHRCSEQYGSLLVKDGKVLGGGWNKCITHPQFRLERKIRQGWINHAEVEALNDVLDEKRNPRGATVYVAGFFCSTGRLFLHREYTCIRCISPLVEHGIESICIPAPEGWVTKPIAEALTDARLFTNGTGSKREQSCLGDYRIESIDLLSPPRRYKLKNL